MLTRRPPSVDSGLGRAVNFKDFDLERLPRGSSESLYVDVTTSEPGDPLRLPVLIVRGAQEGPTITVLGGVHGDEYEGPHAVRTVFSLIDPASLTGTFVGVPHANPPAFAAGTRTSPLDDLNLARVFPGSEDGKPTERIAHHLSESIIHPCDFLIDLHSSGTLWSMPTLVGYDAQDNDAGRRSREAAMAFGAPVVWGHPDIARGRTVTEAADHRIPWLYAECPGGGWLHLDSAAQYAQGVRNVMAHLDMLPGPVNARQPQFRLYGSGDVDSAATAEATGFLVRQVELLDRVREGDILGTVSGLAGEPLEEIQARSDGVVVFMRAVPSITAGDLVFMLASESP